MSEQRRAWRFNDGHELTLPTDSPWAVLRRPDGTYHEIWVNGGVDLEELLPLLGWTQDGVDE